MSVKNDLSLNPRISERAAWLGFHRVPHVGPARIRTLLSVFDSLAIAWTTDSRHLRQALGETVAASIVSTRSTLDPETELERIERSGIQVVTLADSTYPALLAQIPAPPPVLYVRGTLIDDDLRAVAMVGTRRATAYGREAATRIASDLAAAGVTVVSGFAAGIDATAHSAALQAGGRTIAVFGCGVNVIYPYTHRAMAEKVIESGALISEHAPDTKPDPRFFPARNRIISGLSLATVVVEAPERSGALITTDFAADHGRDVFAVPGSVLSENSRGCHKLLRDGARIVTSGADILEDLGMLRDRSPHMVQASLPLDDDERRIMHFLAGGPQHVDEIAAAADLDAGNALAKLAMLELTGRVRNVGSQNYTLT